MNYVNMATETLLYKNPLWQFVNHNLVIDRQRNCQDELQISKCQWSGCSKMPQLKFGPGYEFTKCEICTI